MPPSDASPPAPSRARIGAFLPLETGYGRDVLRGLARYYREFPRIQVLKFNQTTGYDLDRLRELELDGIVAKVAGLREETLFLELGVPTINFSGQYQTHTLPTVTTDERRVGRMAFLHFAQRGFAHFAYCGAAAHFAARLRNEAFSESAAERFAGQPEPPLFVPEGDQDAPFPAHIQEQLKTWLHALPKPVGIFTFTDRLALELVEICRDESIEVPGQVGIIGVGNDLTRIEFAHIPLSSVELPTEYNGYVAARLLENWRLRGERPEPRTLIAPRRLVTRASTDAFAVADEHVAVALDYIHEHLGNPIRVDAVARAAGVSRRSLEERFRRLLHQTIYGVVQTLKFERALELLAQPDVPIGDIAERLGFREPKAFSRAFHQHHGCSPSGYRERILGARAGPAPS